MNIVNICLIAIIGVITAVIIKSYKPEISLLIIIALSLFFLSWMLEIFGEMQKNVTKMSPKIKKEI